MACYNNRDFFKLYKIFFAVNGAFCLIFLALCFFVPSDFAFLNHTLRICDKEQNFYASLLAFWLWDILPTCVVFLIGLTIYIPVLSVACSSFTGIILALDIYAFFESFGIFFAITMTFIRLCAAWLFMWYLSYISTFSVRLYTSSTSFTHTLDYVIVGKYIIWFAVFAFAVLALDTAQCLMFRI